MCIYIYICESIHLHMYIETYSGKFAHLAYRRHTDPQVDITSLRAALEAVRPSKGFGAESPFP